jgi:glycerol-3-phosphate O-acyltransferase
VLARYVQMATGAGVAQAVFPEGGLSLDGRMAEAKLGLLTYLIAEFDGTRRDIVFVPVALNYDRVLEDTILVAASKEGKRRFRGSVPDAARFILRYALRRMRRRAHRMGLAGVAFGTPLSLTDWRRETGDTAARALADALMARVQAAMPVLPVPLVAAVLRVRGPMERAALDAEVSDAAARLRAEGARVLLPEDDGTGAGLLILQRRGLVAEAEGVLGIVPERAEFADYYAATVLPLLDRGADVERAPEVSAT